MDLQENGSCEMRSVELTPLRDVRIVEGYLDDILKGPASGESREDYITARILGSEAILDAMGKIRQVYPNALHIERPDLSLSGRKSSHEGDYRELSDQDLFNAFFKECTGNDLTDAQRSAYVSIVEEMRRSEREALS